MGDCQEHRNRYTEAGLFVWFYGMEHVNAPFRLIGTIIPKNEWKSVRGSYCHLLYRSVPRWWRCWRTFESPIQLLCVYFYGQEHRASDECPVCRSFPVASSLITCVHLIPWTYFLLCGNKWFSIFLRIALVIVSCQCADWLSHGLYCIKLFKKSINKKNEPSSRVQSKH